MGAIKDILKKIGIVKLYRRYLSNTIPSREGFLGSKSYWEERYQTNKNSGAGSYGRLAEFKANILNEFVKNNNIQTIIEFGCGDGNQLGLAQYPNYIGFDVSSKALEICNEIFKGDKTKTFYDMKDVDKKDFNAQVVLSLDVLYHLIEDDIFHDYMIKLFETSNQYVIIYSSNYDKEIDVHVKSRQFTKWINSNVKKDWKLKNRIKNKFPFNAKNPNHTSMSDFYIYEKII